ncbi:uncharacterized protein LOC112633825 [Theropithecus gelada]|uniref:uncharacterized protein LOC112633825 n=1 Tax=Theropithecus gelada TaxID=9565 RepID=UPI000DC19B76|nr:uncharacterized protein LOC112633825 [Theropithecus gelada]
MTTMWQVPFCVAAFPCDGSGHATDKHLWVSAATTGSCGTAHLEAPPQRHVAYTFVLFQRVIAGNQICTGARSALGPNVPPVCQTAVLPCFRVTASSTLKSQPRRPKRTLGICRGGDGDEESPTNQLNPDLEANVLNTGWGVTGVGFPSQGAFEIRRDSFPAYTRGTKNQPTGSGLAKVTFQHAGPVPLTSPKELMKPSHLPLCVENGARPHTIIPEPIMLML